MNTQIPWTLLKHNFCASKDTVSRKKGGPVNGDELANPVSMGKCSGHRGLPQFTDKKVTT